MMMSGEKCITIKIIRFAPRQSVISDLRKHCTVSQSQIMTDVAVAATGEVVVEVVVIEWLWYNNSADIVYAVVSDRAWQLRGC